MMMHFQPRLLATILASSVFLVSLEGSAGTIIWPPQLSESPELSLLFWAGIAASFSFRTIRLFSAAFIAALTLGVGSHCKADIILDEFTDSAMVESPPMEDIFVETPNVGELNARREIRIASSGDPIGTFDTNITSTGQMAVQISAIEASPLNPDPLTAPQFNYYFDPTDVTEGGRNDAILFDFVELRGDIQPTFLRAWVFDETNVGDSFIIELLPLVENTSPHTLIAPFDQFTTRGGAPGVPDPTTLKEIRFDFFFLGHEGELNWSAQLERIRFGATVVPEPGTMQLFWIGALAFCGSSRLLGRQSSALRHLAAVAVVVASASLTTQSATADIILDEFTDPATAAEIIQPPFSPDFVETSNVGELSATRQIHIALGSTNPVGNFDIGNSLAV